MTKWLGSKKWLVMAFPNVKICHVVCEVSEDYLKLPNLTTVVDTNDRIDRRLTWTDDSSDHAILFTKNKDIWGL